MRALVTGGGGFVGSALVAALLERGHAVRVLARGDYPALRAMGAETVRGDITEPKTVLPACAGIDVIFHVAARVGYHGPAQEYEATNIDGTKNLLDACRAHGIGRFVFTSTPSVVHSRAGNEGTDESTPYPSSFPADYPRTKAAAEDLVLRADSRELRTVALRPRGVWGPGDTQLLPRLVEWAKNGQLKRIGKGDPKQSFTYIDNAVEAHLLAEEVLRNDPNRIGGQAFFITDGDPVGAWTMADLVLQAAGHRLPDKRVSLGAARMAAAVIEPLWNLFGVQSEPRITAFKLDVLTKPCWFHITRARDLLGYEPVVTREEGLRRLADWVAAGGLEPASGA